MALFAAAGRIGATLAAMAATRLELAAVEVQQEARGLVGYAAWTLVGAILVAGAFLLTAVFVILVFWDTWRLQAVAAMIALLGLSGAFLLARVRARFEARPALLAATLAELRADLDFIRHAGAGAVAENAHE
jgi:uncharacterized membrane protein YqjE